MKKFFGFLFAFLLSVTTALATDIRLVQIDNLQFSLANEDKFIELIKEINDLKNVDFIVFSGSNISKPNKEELEAFLKTAKKLKKPYYVVLGMKDVNKRKNLSKTEYIQTVKKYARAHKGIENPNYVFEKNGMLFIVADGSKEVIPTPNGYYRDNVLQWIDEQLRINKDKNVVILQHYPIIPPSNRETYYTFKAEDYLKMLSAHKNVKAVISGHFNALNEQKFNGVVHISTSDFPTYRIIDIVDCDTKNPEFWSTIKEIKN